MRNIKFTLSYDGTDFRGWQTQPGYRTVQETLEQAIAAVTGEERVRVNASGRTDAGVHAVGQVVNFFTATHLEPEVLVRAVNAHLPPDIIIREAAEVSQVFDANRDALRKLYRYVIHDGPVPDIFLRRYAWHCKWRLNVEAMLRASRPLLGRHDFHSFETDWPNRMCSIRTITHLSLNRMFDFIYIDMEADGFLYNMVRSIAGTLINVGRGFWPEERVAEILNLENRAEAGPTAPAEGLFLMRVTYAE
ncbi:MAG TPA: tRNA pseudouridine(38-40) synthase TruA [Gemmataceae bacterium]|jgi:tRNA pseudouridine38-40 synthase|nr:tRNA pseudouridine(38-40) synthase TruA [Gemmataceae bacterium]